MQLKEFILRDYFVKSLLNIKAHKGDNIEPYPPPVQNVVGIVIHTICCAEESGHENARHLL